MQVERNYQLKIKAEAYGLPTNDIVVKVRLQQLGAPTHFEGEDVGTRRERLRNVVAKYFIENGQSPDSVFKGGNNDISQLKEGYDSNLVEDAKLILGLD